MNQQLPKWFAVVQLVCSVLIVPLTTTLMDMQKRISKIEGYIESTRPATPVYTVTKKETKS